LTPTLSVLLVNYYSGEDLSRVLPSLASQGVASLEIIVVDNSHDDRIATWLAQHHPSVQVIANPSNTGYADGNNLALAHATGDWVLIANPDTEFAAGALPALVRSAREHPDALLSPKLINPDGTVNACGNELHFTGITICRGMNTARSAGGGVHPVPLISGAAFIVRRDVLLELGGFDEAYFMYMEDADLSIRARLLGYRTLCDEDAVVTHDYQLGMNAKKFYYLERNRLLTVFKAFEKTTLVRLAPALLLTEVATWMYAVLMGPRYLASRARGYAWLWRHRRLWRATRRETQSSRRVSDAAILGDSVTSLPFSQLVRSATAARVLDAITRPLYALLRPKRITR